MGHQPELQIEQRKLLDLHLELVLKENERSNLTRIVAVSYTHLLVVIEGKGHRIRTRGQSDDILQERACHYRLEFTRRYRIELNLSYCKTVGIGSDHLERVPCLSDKDTRKNRMTLIARNRLCCALHH